MNSRAGAPCIVDDLLMTDPRRLLDSQVGDWVNKRLLDHNAPGVRAGSVVPVGFERVVRVLHPAAGRSWKQVAAETGRVAHPLVQWCGISPNFAGSGREGDVDPEEGSVPEGTLGAILDHCLTADELIYAVWTGHGSWHSTIRDQAVMPGWGGRDYALFTASKAPLMRWPGMDNHWPQSANLIWPMDHAWCIATEIDWDSTLIAGSSELVESLLSDARLEIYEIAYEDDLSWLGDRVNPRPVWLQLPPHR